MLDHRTGLIRGAVIQHGIDQAERADRMALIKGPLNQARGEAAAGAIAGDRDARGIPAQLIAVFLRPA